MLKKYIAYLKDNPKGYWFKRKLYGWGWTPARWQGWVVLLVFSALAILNSLFIDSTFIFRTIILVLILSFICWKTGEKPRWQWGFPKDIDKQQ